MIEVREASPGETQSWLDSWSERLQAWYTACSGEAQWVSQKVERRQTRWREALGRHVFTVVATNWLKHEYAPGTSFVFGVEVVNGHRGKGFGKAAMLLGEQVCLEAGDNQLGLNVFGQNSVAIGLYQKLGYVTAEKYRSLALTGQT